MSERKHHRAIKVKYRKGVVLDVTFEDGLVKRYDMSRMFDKYPQLKALKNRILFESGKLYHYAVVWNDELDFDTESIYETGETVRKVRPFQNVDIGGAVALARMEKGLSQTQLAEKTGMDQSDISKIERGVANPSINTLRRIAEAIDCDLKIKFDPN